MIEALWVLIVYVNGAAGFSFSPPVPTIEDCERMATAVKSMREVVDARCILIKVNK